MGTTYKPLLDKEVTPVRATRVTAGATWLKRNFGVARRVTLSATADCSCILAKDAASAEASIITEVNVSAGGSRHFTLLENYAGDVYVHTLTAKCLVHCEYE